MSGKRAEHKMCKRLCAPQLASALASPYKRRAGDLPVLSRGDKMSERDSDKNPEVPPSIGLSPAKVREKARLAAALKANLQRRKAQARARAAGPGPRDDA